MRIIAGKYKGHVLVPFKASHIRPTTDRVKETLFNKWQFDLEGSRCLDLFSGTGNLGLEAISRGAEFVLFVEKHPQSVSILEKNIEKLRVEKKFYQIHQKEVLLFLKQYSDEGFDHIFIDPPFTERMAHFVMEALSVSSVIQENTCVAIESSSQERIDKSYGFLECYDQKFYGDKTLSFFRRTDGL